ncbi:MAG: PPC domain-containing protein [Planctomycetales bacterium]|nr:PPC domain-containing protein [Planctomycetales bacterium]
MQHSTFNRLVLAVQVKVKIIRAGLCVIAMTVAIPASADNPAISMFTPAGGQRGTEIDVSIAGARIDDVRQLHSYTPGISVLGLTAENGNRVKAKLAIAEDCPIGLHALRLVTETGISNLRLFGVSALPQIEETEPNNRFDAPQVLSMNSTVNGVVKTEDVDYYAINLSAGQRVNVELEGLRLGTEFFDPFVAILDTNRFELAASDDAPLVQQDCVCTYTAKEDGTYVIEVRESSFGGNDRCQYRLHVGSFPRPVSILPSGGRPGETIQATVVDISGETWQQEIQLPETPGDYEFVAERNGQWAPSANKLRVIDLPNYMETADDAQREALVAVDLPAAFNGVIETPGDTDWFKFRAKKDQQLEFVVYGRRVLRSPIDSWLEIHKVGGGRLAANDDANGPDSSQPFKIPEDGEYLVSIRDQLSEGSPQHTYRIEVSPPRPELTLSIDELQRYVSQNMEVPQGSRMAVLLRAGRKNFGGDLELLFENLPAGIHVSTPKMAANESYIPFMLEANPDAPISSELVHLGARLNSENTDIIGQLDQRTLLVRGQNNRDMWGFNSDRLAVAITKQLPFQIELIQPQIPIVRNGALNYQVRVQRAPEYKETIYLQTLYNPSGLRASGSIKLEGDATEALIPVTANGNAALGNFPITILARAKGTNSTVWTASNFVNLEVADSFFNFKFGKTVIETGARGSVVVGLEAKRPAEGIAEFELVGLPAGVTSPQAKVTYQEGQSQLEFPIDVAPDARVGQFKMLVIKATITRDGGTIEQNQGTGEIQIAQPLPATTAVAVNPSNTGEPAAKPLSRLDQLRQAKAAGGGE